MDPLRLKLPIEPLSFSQQFGEDLTCVDIATQTKCVTRAGDSECPEGYASLYSSAGMLGHDGIDLKATDGQEVYAACEGIVRELVDEAVRGKGIGIVSEERYDVADGTYHAKVRYWHLKSFAVELDRKVHAGELIGYADNTGLSAGSHLHFELKPVERYPGGFKNVFQENGYFGAIDPLPYFVGLK